MVHKIIFMVTFILLFSVEVHAFGKIFGSLMGALVKPRVSVEEALSREAYHINKKAPTYLDRNTRLDLAEVGPGRLFTIHYTLLDVSANQLHVPSFRQDMREQLLNTLCEHSDMRKMFRHKVTLSYSYRGNDNRQISVITITPRDCGLD